MKTDSVLMRIRILFILLISCLLWTGCANTIEVMLEGQSDMNDGGNAAVVHVYELKGENNFANTPLSAFWRDVEGALGGDLIASHQQRVYPDERETLTFDLKEGTQVLGVAANLRDPDQEEWRAYYSVEELGDEIAVIVHSNRISVKAEEAGILKRAGVTD